MRLRVAVLLACVHTALQSGDHSWIRPATTGTTIVGCLCDRGVVLGADTRATRHTAISNKRTRKIHRVSDHIYCCGAGVAADAAQFAARLRLHIYKLQALEQQHRRIGSGELRGAAVGVSAAAAAAAELLAEGKHRFDVGVIMGGMDPEEGGTPRLFQFSSDFPCGIEVQSCALGSGMLAANAVLDSLKVRNTVDAQGRRRIVLPTTEEAVRIVSRAVLAGIHNDLGSGSNVDICIIDKNGATLMEPYIESPRSPSAKAAETHADVWPQHGQDGGGVGSGDGEGDSDGQQEAKADLGEFVCSRRNIVRKLAFRRDSAEVVSEEDSASSKGPPFASVI